MELVNNKLQFNKQINKKICFFCGIIIIVGGYMKNIERFLDYLKSVRGLSQNTIINYKIDLRDFYKFTEGKKIDLDIIRN